MIYEVDLLPGKSVFLDKRTTLLGGSFYPGIPPHVYEPEAVEWVYNQLSQVEQPVLIDVGASTGSYSLLAAHIPDLRVYAFEPVPLTREVLQENVFLNRLENRVEVCDEAIGERTDMQQSFMVVDPPLSSALSMLGGNPNSHKSYHEIQVSVMALDDFCLAEDIAPTLIKIDVEGGEMAVLRGMSQICQKSHPIVVCEYSTENASQYGYHPDQLIDVLHSYGYNVERANTDLRGT